jgi:hypothetical protein
MGGIAAIGLLLALMPVHGTSAETAEGVMPESATPPFVVVGVVIPDRGASLAAIEDRATMRTQFYRVGDQVSGGVVKAIARDRVTIAFGGELVLFRLAGVAGPADVSPPTARPPRSPAQRPVAGRRWDAPSSPYGRLGAITPVSPRLRAGTRRDDDTGGATGGGAAAGAGAGAGVGAGASTTGVQFTGVLHGGSEQAGEQFSAQSLRDLLISVNHANVSATTQRIELSTPDGGLYQKFAGDATPASQVRVPIGGTWITEHGLFGTWTVRVYLDRQPSAAATGAFLLTP